MGIPSALVQTGPRLRPSPLHRTPGRGGLKGKGVKPPAPPPLTPPRLRGEERVRRWADEGLRRGSGHQGGRSERLALPLRFRDTSLTLLAPHPPKIESRPGVAGTHGIFPASEMGNGDCVLVSGGSSRLRPSTPYVRWQRPTLADPPSCTALPDGPQNSADRSVEVAGPTQVPTAPDLVHPQPRASPAPSLDTAGLFIEDGRR